MGRRSALRAPGLAASVAVAALVALGGGGVRSLPVASGAPVPEPDLRRAADVVIRGRKTLEEAIRAAMPTSVVGAAPPLVAFVVDVTPNVKKRAEILRSTIARLDRDETFAREIRLAPLGRALASPSKNLDELNAEIASVLAKETPAVNTMAELKRSVASLREPAVVVYLCDWRFEDDFQVDALASEWATRKIAFGAVGTEAAFGRAWTDGTLDLSDRMSGRGSRDDHYPGVGRSPFGKPVAEAPWHGGDGAYPPLPYRFHGMLWKTEFQPPSKTPSLLDAFKKKPDPDVPGKPPGDDPLDPAEDEDPEDVLDRLREGDRSGFDPDAIRTYPIPSSFGPYGLMRLAAVTGGRYSLWSWNPGGRARVTYDYARCNLYGPDLRSREAILPEIGRDPLSATTIETWAALLADGLVNHTPPLEKDLRSPRSVDESHVGSDLHNTSWDSVSDWKALRRGVAKAKPVVVAARARLTKALAGAKDPETDLGRRRLAEARLLELVLHVLEFELRELDLATKDVKSDLWRSTPKGKTPGVCPSTFIAGSANALAELAELGATGLREPALDVAAGERIAKARQEHLERFKGTPFGAQVELPDVCTFRLVEWERGSPIRGGGMPSESGGATPPPTPGGGPSQGGGGPTTGR